LRKGTTNCIGNEKGSLEAVDVLMALGAVAIALSSATGREHLRWQGAAEREAEQYGIAGAYVRAGIEGREFEGG